MSENMQRPLSPHLQVYKPQLTSVTSILHRATGYGLSVGLAFFTWWLVAAASGPEAYQTFTSFCGSLLGIGLLFGWSLAFYYHLANGIRHLIWDSGFLFKIKNAYAAGYFVLFFTVVMTALTWVCIMSSY
ncbi:MAG: succinate dehydrogenase, cytochrome b556 subunit [Micavibrio sp.]|nr:MAG: succinate dehydrogenase, cytochrome b556 subunit [Micavibrio sp.]